jgi:hypothetical protein
MRGLSLLLAVAALVGGIYYGYLKNTPVTDKGTAPTQAISLTGVRSDLLQIAQAERSYVAANGNCVALPELITANMLNMTRTERDGYVYTVECASGEFSATARHAAAPPGSPIRYPNLAIDQNMAARELE